MVVSFVIELLKYRCLHILRMIYIYVNGCTFACNRLCVIAHTGFNILKVDFKSTRGRTFVQRREVKLPIDLSI